MNWLVEMKKKKAIKIAVNHLEIEKARLAAYEVGGGLLSADESYHEWYRSEIAALNAAIKRLRRMR